MKKTVSVILKGIASLVLTIALTGCSSSNTQSSGKSDGSSSTPITENAPASSASASSAQPEINVLDIFQKYDQDPDKHTPVYDGSSETAAGVVVYIGKDDHGTDSMQLSDTKDGTPYVLGVFGSADEMSSVSVGDTVAIIGNFHIMSSKDMVVLKQCRILEAYK